MNLNVRVLTFLFAPLVLVPLGCSGKDSTGSTLEGRVTLNGQPIDNGVINFDPKLGGSTAVAPINPDGSYEARMSRSLVGIQPGEYVVSIEAWKYPPGAIVDGKEYVDGVSAVPPDYRPGGAKEISITIESNESHSMDFELQGEGESEASVESQEVPEA